jgi:hypothetical protein
MTDSTEVSAEFSLSEGNGFLANSRWLRNVTRRNFAIPV